MSRSELYRTAIEEYLKRHEDAAITERLNRVYSDPRNQPDKELTDFAVEMLRRADGVTMTGMRRKSMKPYDRPAATKRENAADQQPQRCARVRQIANPTSHSRTLSMLIRMGGMGAARGDLVG